MLSEEVSNVSACVQQQVMFEGCLTLLIGKDSDAGRDLGQEEKGTTEDEMAGWRTTEGEMAGWHHRLGGCEFE